MKHICDTNFIVRYLLADNHDMLVKTKEIFDKAKTGEITVIIEQAVFTEVIFVLTSFYKAPKNTICDILTELLSYKGINCYNKDTILLALKYYQELNIHIVDCLLLANAKKHDTSVLTFDKKLISYVTNKDLY
ncbi:PIN domain-containing protein [Rickettsia sp. TH2014]|uniref:PIN domain-containing protein n=1 Tax=Rickettsia sp. TH2014 TaxID=1967503 RepID=UPI001C47D8B3|nr:PIN domain-containing protein [Rickettsia sp. TH2014]